MLFAVDLVSENFVQDYVFRAAEQVLLHLRVGRGGAMSSWLLGGLSPYSEETNSSDIL